MLGEKIKMLRKSQGLRQEDFAAKLSVTPSAVSFWESNKTRPDFDRLVQMSKVFSVPLDYFSDDPNINYSETELIKQHLLIELKVAQPQTPEAKILARGIDKLPKEQREQALAVVRAMFIKHPELFEKGSEDDEP